MRGIRDWFPDSFVSTGLEDVHVHTDACDDAEQTAFEALTDANDRGLTFVCFTAHVRESTKVQHVERYVAAAREASENFPNIQVRYSVETKLMNSRGDLDLPPDIPQDLLDTVHISDHRVPLDEARSPSEVAKWLAEGQLTETDFWEALRDSYRHSLPKYPGAIVAHPLSIVPKIGLDPESVPDWFCTDLAASAADSGAVIEINNKWSCPGARLLIAAHDRKVPILAASDAHRAGETGTATYLRTIRPKLGLTDGIDDS